MYTDTHFHFHMICEHNSIEYGSQILSQMADTDCFFGMDIGTRSNDLLPRVECVKKSLGLIQDEQQRNKASSFIHFSAGIWPDVESIVNRERCMKELEETITAFEDSDDPFCNKIVAIGEGGIDHHWNPSGADGRCQEDFDRKILEGERELFQMQLELSRKLNKPYIVHSRDGFEDTLSAIKETGWHKGIIHCYSYGLDEARQFLDLGWYISLSGSVTYTKKSKMEQMKEMIAYIPQDRLLLETDAPYLAPVPMRGNPNTPCFVRHTYEFVAQQRNISVEELCTTVDSNCRNLFSL